MAPFEISISQQRQARDGIGMKIIAPGVCTGIKREFGHIAFCPEVGIIRNGVTT
jgi:hypothetical protein